MDDILDDVRPTICSRYKQAALRHDAQSGVSRLKVRVGKSAALTDHVVLGAFSLPSQTHKALRVKLSQFDHIAELWVEGPNCIHVTGIYIHRLVDNC